MERYPHKSADEPPFNLIVVYFQYHGPSAKVPRTKFQKMAQTLEAKKSSGESNF